MALARRALFYVSPDRNQNDPVLLLTVHEPCTDRDVAEARATVLGSTQDATFRDQITTVSPRRWGEHLNCLLDEAGINATVSIQPVIGSLIEV